MVALTILWAWQVYASWAAWGNLTIDSGHEMYVPAVLAEGQTLYSDVWFMYGPISPYFNSYLFRIFGIHLNVLYWAGALSALVSALLLVVIGRRVSAWSVGWAAGAILLLQAFERSLFCFPLPYSFAAVYGCVVGLAFLWTAIWSVQSTDWRWTLWAGFLAAVGLLTKPEFGLASYCTLGVTIILRQRQGTGTLWRDCAAVLPGALLCAVVIFWMVSLRGVDFITHENIVTWPSSYFMKTYGIHWLNFTGLSLSWAALGAALVRAVLPVSLILLAFAVLNWSRIDALALSVRLALTLLVLVFGAGATRFVPAQVAGVLLFPPDMVFYVALTCAACWWVYMRRPEHRPRPAMLVLFTFTVALCFRLMFKMMPMGYPIFYNGPAIVSFLLVVGAIVRGFAISTRAKRAAEVVASVACVLAVAPRVGHWAPVRGLDALVTDRGSVRVPHDMAANYRAALTFMRDRALAGEYVSSVPEDTSLYFLSHTYSPTRMYSFTPGVIAPGKMTRDTIREFEDKRVRYILWSNRTFTEFGVPVFGTDFNRELGDYFRARYVYVKRITPRPGWTADVWERKQEDHAAAGPAAASRQPDGKAPPRYVP
jgi:hypothetical protein